MSIGQLTQQTQNLPPKSIGNPLKQLLSRSKAAWHVIKPDARAWRRASFGVALATVGLLVTFVFSMQVTGVWALASSLVFVVLAGLLAALSDLIVLILSAIPKFYRAILIGSALILALSVFAGFGVIGTLVMVTIIVIAASLIGAAVWTWASEGWAECSRPQRVTICMVKIFKQSSLYRQIDKVHTTPVGSILRCGFDRHVDSHLRMLPTRRIV